MDTTFTVTFKGFSEKHADVLERWLRDDVGDYPARMSMDVATVTYAKRVVRSAAKAGSVPIAVVKEAVEKVKHHAES